MFIYPKRMINILTFDIEEWYEANYPGIQKIDFDSKKSRLSEETLEILDLCKEYDIRATFFVLGKAAERNPELVRKIKEGGHEIASHGYSHNLVYNLTKDEFKKDLEKSLKILEEIAGEKIFGYRAPSWSLNEKTEWAYPAMAELGLKYSASIFPIKSSFFGLADAPRFPFKKEGILEIPTSTLNILGKNFPFSGGAFFRILPLFFIKRGIRDLNKKGKPAIIYIHPREIDARAPRLKLPLKEHLLHYWGVKGNKKKMVNILRSFKFGSIKDNLLSQNL